MCVCILVYIIIMPFVEQQQQLLQQILRLSKA